ncbi:hypothetical protein FB45DRAFT_1021350 [Roridomyces roridus]|uniref:F-box domain-containing protein n=1 Tax=Roridomyces roridus TaxID=1738132 RepID=A0AAD7CC98_9AGAR|nr:hypothetical protein FB45DRAFT_1021350 [Roridomyces roridus]
MAGKNEPQDTLLNLSLVCRYWQDIAMCTFELYTDLLCCRVDQLANYAARAGSLPLTMKLSLVGPQSSSDSQKLRQLWLQHASQWEFLGFAPRSGASVPTELPVSFPRLNTFKAATLVAFNAEMEIDLPHLLDAPRLQRLILHCDILALSWQLKLPWAQITVLEVNNPLFGRQWWLILCETPNLEQLLVMADKGRFVPIGATLPPSLSKDGINFKWPKSCVNASLENLRKLRADGMEVSIASHFKWHTRNLGAATVLPSG